MADLNLNSVMISSSDPKPLIEFYRKALGKPTMEENSYTGWLIGSGFLSIGPHDQIHGKSKEPARVMFFLESKDVEGDFKKFEEAGAEVVAKPYKPDPKGEFLLSTLADPDGNYFQLASPWDTDQK